jgi:4-alpha-glucanotransferase
LNRDAANQGEVISLGRAPRRAGVLLHPTSLPGPHAGGVLGNDALRFVDWLAEAGFQLWQMLPVGPVGASLSPYQLTSAFAGNPRLLDPEALAEAKASAGEPTGLQPFWARERSWLLPYALFCVARERFGEAGWWTWPAPIRDREPRAIAGLLSGSRAAIRDVVFSQWQFAVQWQRLRAHAAARGIALVGDLPIYVDLDSADAWWHRRLFRLDPDGRPTAVAGVPPDYFSADGQLWGNPLYRWDEIAATGYDWWRARVRAQLARFDYLRIDHFRGLESYWEVPATATTAREGRWLPGPGAALFDALRPEARGQPFFAEDLGTITPAVQDLRRRLGMPGTLVLQFAFDGSADNPYLPARHPVDAVLYSGTHDNDTLAGWATSLSADTQRYAAAVLGCEVAALIPAMRRAVWESPAATAIFPLQDLLGLGTEARMNVPGIATGNWRFRFSWAQVPADLAAACRGEALRVARAG